MSGDSAMSDIMPSSTRRRRCVLVAGPESSGTRWIAGLLSQHPLALGTSGEHEDPLQKFWSGEGGAFPAEFMDGGYQLLVTRRSLPSSRDLSSPANYLQFDDLRRLDTLCEERGIELVLVITTRSPLANLQSWTDERASTSGEFGKAIAQYHASYRFLFDTLASDIPYWFVSLEGAVSEGAAYVSSLFRLLGLEPFTVLLSPNAAVNFRQYAAFELATSTHYKLDEVIEFSDRGEGRFVVGRGWAVPEPNHIWCLGKRSDIRVQLDRVDLALCTQSHIEFSLHLKPFLVSGVLDSQYLQVSVNGKPVVSAQYSGAKRLRLAVPKSLLEQSPITTIALVHPDSAAPSQILPDSSDDKVLAFAMYSLEFHS